MSKRGKQKKADNVEKRRLQLEEAMECLAIKQAAEENIIAGVTRKVGTDVLWERPSARQSAERQGHRNAYLNSARETIKAPIIKKPADKELPTGVAKTPKQCTFKYCGRYVDPSCTVCPYCGTPLQPVEAFASASFHAPALQV